MAQPARNVTQAEIARSLGVHQTTVSAILSNRRSDKFAPEMRERVLKAAQKLGYRPSASARALRGVRSGLIGVLHFGRDKDVESQRLHEIIQAIHGCGYQPLAMPMAAKVMRLSRHDEISACTVMLDANIEGLILSGFADDFDLAQLKRFQEVNIPIISITGIKLPEIAFFGPDRRKAVYDLTSHLIAQGRRKLIYVHRWASELTPLVEDIAFADVEGFQQAAREHGLSLEQAIPYVNRARLFSYDAGAQAFAEIWEGGARPEAVICYDDGWALGVYGYCQRKGIRIPEDIAVVGYENQRLGNHLYPALTTASLPYAEIVPAALDYLTAALKEGEASLKDCTKLYPCTLEIRESCGAALKKP